MMLTIGNLNYRWPAVTLGAMYRGLQVDIVKTRIIRAAYGTRQREPWAEKHELEPIKTMAAANKYDSFFIIMLLPMDSRQLTNFRKWDTPQQIWMCCNVARWYVQKVCCKIKTRNPFTQLRIQVLICGLVL